MPTVDFQMVTKIICGVFVSPLLPFVLTTLPSVVFVKILKVCLLARETPADREVIVCVTCGRSAFGPSTILTVNTSTKRRSRIRREETSLALRENAW